MIGGLSPAANDFTAATKSGSPTARHSEANTQDLVQSLIFPQTANGAATNTVIRSGVILINHAGRSARGTIRFFGNDGAPAVFGTSLGAGDNFSFDLEAGQALRIETDGRGLLQTGWTRVDSDVALSGSGTFAVADGSGNHFSEVGIGHSPPQTRQLIPVENAQGSYTSFAICNPDSTSSVNILLGLRSLNGGLLASRTITLGPLAHLAQYVAQVFTQIEMQDFSGVLDISSDIPVGIVALRSTGTGYTSMPSVSELSEGKAGQDLIFPRVGDGCFGNTCFQTAFVVLNNSDDARTAHLQLFSSDGTPMRVTIGSTTSSRFAATVPARGAVELVANGRSDPGVLGWARITGDKPLGGGARLISVEKASGAYLSEAGVSASATAADSLLYIRESDGSFTGLALSNGSEEELTARLRLYQGSAPLGQAPWAEKILALPARSSMGRFVFEFFPDVPELAGGAFEGRLEVATWMTRFGEDIPATSSVLTLLCRGAQYTSLPAASYQPDTRPLSGFDSQVNDLLAQMTLDEKVGQMTQAERGSLSDGDIENYFLGSVLSGGGSGPNVNSVGSWAEMYDGFQSQALKTRLKIPILYGVDAVHGHNNVRGAVIFPHNIGLGATGNPDLVRMAAQITASEVRATGINWTFSPVVAVPQDERWGRTYEGFGEDPDLVRAMGQAAVLGFQGTSLAGPSSIVACAKHYLGDGGTRWGTGSPIDQGDAQVDEATLRRIHLPGYLGALQSNVGTIMVSFSSWNGQKMTGNHYLLTDVLKGELGFEGFLVTDWSAIDQLPYQTYRDQVKAAVNAGIDMGMVPSRHREYFGTLKGLALSGEVPQSRIDDAVRRILRVKFAAGLFDRSPLTDPSYQARFGSREHREVARETVRQSLVLLKNERGLLPLSKSLGCILVAGANADDIGRQCGGWTITWQGASGAITPGTTILQAIRQTVSASTQVTYSRDGSGAAGADVGIVVVGEPPYAEGPGDNGTLGLPAQDIAAIDNVKGAGIPVLVVLMSGRPLILGTALDKADALFAAWLPGTEGQGVADVLFGDYHPAGRLPCSWPRSISQVPINIGEAQYDPLFPYGFGLTY